MYKKSRITALKHRVTRKKQHERRGLARRLIRGDITLDQLERLAGPASRGVLRTVNYLSETEGTTLSTALAQAVVGAVAPVSTGAAQAPRRTPAPRRPARAAETTPAAEAPAAADAPAPAPRRRATRAADAEPAAAPEASAAETPAAETAETAPEEAATESAASEEATPPAPRRRSRASSDS